jgi:hypothetical protein
MATAHFGRSIPELFSDVIVQLTTLLRKEGQLARAEMSENFGKLAMGLALVVGGAVLLIPALVILLQACVAALIGAGLAPYWSALIVGGIVLILGLALMMVGVGRLRVDTMIPNKTIHQFQEDASMGKDQMRSNHDIHRAA